jgi:hypothetical protein
MKRGEGLEIIKKKYFGVPANNDHKKLIKS